MSILGESFDLRAVKFADVGKSAGKLGGKTPAPRTVTAEQAPRIIDFKTIDYVVNVDPYSYATINKPVQWIINAGFKLSSPKKGTLKFFNEFFDNIGLVGDEITHEELHDENLRDAFKYGNDFMELIYDTTDKLIIDIRRIKTARVDYARDKAGNIAVDQFSKPYGYVIQEDKGFFAGTGSKKESTVPIALKDVVQVKSGDRFIDAHRIAHIKFNKDSSGFWGVGIMQPALKSILRRMKIEEAEVNTIYTKSQQPLIASVGDERHEAGEDDLKKVVDVLSNIKHDRIFAFPDWVKVKALETSDNDSANTAIDRLSVANSATSGVPMGFLTGKDGSAQRGTLSAMQTMLESNLDYYIKSYTSQFKKLVIDRIAKVNGFDNNIRFIWNTVVSEDKNDKVKRLFTYSQMLAIAPEEIRKIAIDSEDIERDDMAYEKFVKESKASETKSAQNTKMQSKTQPEGNGSENDQEKKELMGRKQ
jgi:hypothetical protein